MVLIEKNSALNIAQARDARAIEKEIIKSIVVRKNISAKLD